MTRRITLALASLLACLVTLAIGPKAEAGCGPGGGFHPFRGMSHRRAACQPATSVTFTSCQSQTVIYQGQPPAPLPFPPAPPKSGPTPQAPTPSHGAYQQGDPYGFTAWLNGVRAENGRGPVGYDANLSGWAAVNNGQQFARGMGHHVMGSARRQNSGMGAAQAVWSMWMASPPHQAALLDPTITMIGVAASGSYWTFNAY